VASVGERSEADAEGESKAVGGWRKTDAAREHSRRPVLFELSISIGGPEAATDGRTDKSAERDIVIIGAVLLEGRGGQGASDEANATANERPAGGGPPVPPFHAGRDLYPIDSPGSKRPDLRPHAVFDHDHGVAAHTLIAPDNRHNDLRGFDTNPGSRGKSLRARKGDWHKREKCSEQRAVKATGHLHDVF
jgi:hypothetical protein